jgi:ZIP family zinc transporter
MFIQAVLLGGLAQISLLLSGLFATWVQVPTRIIGLLAGFGAGSIIGAVAFDLIIEAEGSLGGPETTLWLLAGAAIFVIGDALVERKFGPPPGEGSADGQPAEAAASPLGIVLGAVVDGIPESLIFGIGVATGSPLSIAFLAAVIVSNIPQALAPSADLVKAGWSRGRLATVWGAVVIASALASGLGYLLASASPLVTGDRFAAIAAGGLLAMLTDSLMPFAFERGQRAAGVATVIGFALSVPATLP